MSNLKLSDEQWHEIYQVAFTAYVDAAQSRGHAQERLEAGSRAAARAVAWRLAEYGAVRTPLTKTQANILGQHARGLLVNRDNGQ